MGLLSPGCTRCEQNMQPICFCAELEVCVAAGGGGVGDVYALFSCRPFAFKMAFGGFIFCFISILTMSDLIMTNVSQR